MIADASELPNHSPSTQLLRSLGDRWATFLITDSLVQDQPDEPTLPMGNSSDGLIVTPRVGELLAALKPHFEVQEKEKVEKVIEQAKRRRA